jgi:hypothetical protein
MSIILFCGYLDPITHYANASERGLEVEVELQHDRRDTAKICLYPQNGAEPRCSNTINLRDSETPLIDSFEFPPGVVMSGDVLKACVTNLDANVESCDEIEVNNEEGPLQFGLAVPELDVTERLIFFMIIIAVIILIIVVIVRKLRPKTRPAGNIDFE